MADEPTKNALRLLEAELDKHHRMLPIFTATPGAAAYALLAAFDGLYVIEQMITPQNHFDICVMQDRRSFEEGLAQALRWLLEKNATVDLVPSGNQSAIEQAFQFINHAGDYYHVETFHVMLGKGWAEVTVDLEQKQVRFEPSADRNARKMMAGYEEGFGDQQGAQLGKKLNRHRAALDAANRHIEALRPIPFNES